MALLIVLASVSGLVTGCGSGGYAGGGITSLSQSTATIDAGQTVSVSATIQGNLPLTWTLSGANCSGATCGTVSTGDSSSAVYTAPAAVSTQMVVVLTAAIPGTNNSKIVTITVNPALAITGNTPSGTVGTAYSGSVSTTGGTAPVTMSLVAGTLPAGLTFDATTGKISGTPTAVGTASFTIRAADKSDVPTSVTAVQQITIAASGGMSLSISGNPPAGVTGTAYSTTLRANGGTQPATFAVTSGALPAGLTLSASGVISGTPTAAGSSTFTVTATDAAGTKASATFTIAVTAGGSGGSLTISTGTLPNGTVNVAYSATIGVTGGTGPYTCTIVSGTLPTGLSLGAGCAVTGTPTVAGTSQLMVRAMDSSNPALTVTGAVNITINAPGLSIGSGTLPNGTVGVTYTATIPVTGGTAPYTCTLTSGTLPAGLTLGANCAVSGTPTTAGTSTPTITVKDSASPAQTITPTVSITINPAGLSIGSGTLPNGTVGVTYTATLPVTGGTAPYTCTLTSGTLPAGLTLGANCAVSGTPTTAGTSTPTITVKDSANPPQTITPTVSITINPAGLSIGSGTLPNGTVGVTYTATLPVTGGTAPYTCTLTSGTLPAGLTLGTNCAVSGTPTTAGTSTPTITVKDASNPQQTITPTVSITINASTLSISSGTLPNGMVGTAYTATLPVTGGTSPYTCTLTSGSLPAGLTLGANCSVSGTPTTAGTSTPTITVKDSSNPQQTITPTVSITIDPSNFRVTNGTLPNGTVGTPYSQLIPIVGGTSPYSCTLASGAVPPGLTFNANCTVSGTPSAAGTYQTTLTIKDSSSPQQTITSAISITINPVTLTLGSGGLPNGTVGTAYTATLPVSGGTAPYACTVTSGTLPAGLTLGAGCTVTGTPTTAGTSTPTVLVTDSANPAATTSGPVSITIVAAPSVLVISSPPPATVNVPYTGTIPVTGGTGPYTCQVVTGTVPGLTINANCTVTGTPTTPGATPVTVKVTDSSSPTNTKTGTTTITVNAPTTTLTLSAPPVATVNVPYTGTIGVTGGTAPYTCTLASGTLPAGLTLGTNCVVTGTPTTVAVTTVNVTATDSANPANTTTAPVVITVQAVPALTFTGSLPNAIVGVAYSQTLQASGGVAPYTYAVTAGALPAGLNLSSTGTVSGTPTTAGASSFTVTATDSEGTPQTKALPLVLLVTYPVTPDDGKLKGPYAYLFQGNDDAVLGVLAYRTATAASFTADGLGVISAGEMDSNHQVSNPTGNTIATTAFLGTYTIGTDLRGSLTLSTLATDGTVASTTTYAIALRAPVSPITVSAAGSLVLADTNLLASSKGSGTLLLQDATKLAAGLNGSYVFGLQGDSPCFPTCTVGLAAGPAASVGQFTASNNTITGTGDANLAQFNYAQSTLAGSYSAADANGRVQLTMSTSKLTGVPFPTDYAVYVVDATHLFVVSTDKHSAYVLQAGTAQLQTQATYSNASLNSAFVGYENSPVNPGLVGATLQNVASLSSATIFRATGNNNGTCTTTNVDTGGTTGLVNSIAGAVGGGAPLIGNLLGTYQSLGNSTCAVATNGRAVLNYPAPSSLLTTVLALLGVQAVAPAPRIVYLVSPNSGYFLESSYAGVGTIEQQTATPTTVATLNGKFIYSQVPASTIATIAASGEFTADGAGNAVTTLDETVGVGSLNVLQLGVTQNNTYTLTDGTAGRYNLGNYGTIYAIAPGRFVLLQTDAVGTSPYIALLY